MTKWSSKDNRATLYTGDCLNVLKSLPTSIFHMCVTSPPYFNLRDYGVDGQIGMENTPQDYISNLSCIFREIKRVLREEATLWVNISDTYCGGGRGGNPEESKYRKQATNVGSLVKPSAIPQGMKARDLMGIPWMLAFALRADGWYLRSDIIWSKPNPMPESVENRPTKSHEYIFMLSKQPNYYCDMEAIKEKATYAGQMRGGSTNRYEQNAAGMDNKEYSDRNKRSVWTVNSEPYKDAHFATFPSKLITPCILAGTSHKGCCSKCGAPYVRQTEKQQFGYAHSDTKYEKGSSAGNARRSCQAYRAQGLEGPPPVKTIGWTASCKCNAEIVPCTVLDCFNGSGTSVATAIRYGRRGIGIELNPEYIELSKKRINKSISERGLFR